LKYFIISLLLITQSSLANFSSESDILARNADVNAPITGYWKKEDCEAASLEECFPTLGQDLDFMELKLVGQDKVFVENAVKKTAKEAMAAGKAIAEAARQAKRQGRVTSLKAALTDWDTLTDTQKLAAAKDAIDFIVDKEADAGIE